MGQTTGLLTASRELPTSLSDFTKVLLAVVVSWLLLNPAVVQAFSGFGGYISEKLLGDGTNGALYLGDGVNNLTVLGAIPTISTLSPIVDGKNATLRGSVDNMRGFPTSNVYFKWGYNPSSLTNTTPVQVATTTGIYTASITTDGPVEGAIYYRFYAEADGTGYVNSSFNTEPSHGVYWLVRILPYVFVALTLLMLTVGLVSGNIGMVIISAILVIIGIVGASVIWNVVASLW